MTFHWQIRRLLSAYTEGSLNAQQRALVAQHLEACPSCAAIVARQENTRQRLRDARPEQVLLSSEAGDAIFRRAMEEAQLPRLPNSRLRPLRLALAGGLTLCCLALLLLRYPGVSRNKQTKISPILQVRQHSANPPSITDTKAHKYSNVRHRLADRLAVRHPQQNPTRHTMPVRNAHSLLAINAERASVMHGPYVYRDRENSSLTRPAVTVASKLGERRTQDRRFPDSAGEIQIRVTRQPEATPGSGRLVTLQTEDDGSEVRVETTIRQTGKDITISESRTMHRVGAVRPASVLSIQTIEARNQRPQGAT